jgi:penicillin-binding protein 1B
MRVGDKIWSPKNYDHSVNGYIPLYRGLASSLNLATVNLGMSLGVKRVTETLYRLGAQRRIQTVPAILLGAVSLSPLEVAQMYQTIAAGGYRAPLRAIREVMDQNGRPLNRYPLAVEAAVDPAAAYLTTWAMQQVVRQGTAKWLGARLPEGMTMAGKTGTTDDMRDSWFAGFSGDKVAVVWVGRDDYKPMGLAGGSGALRVWGEFMLAMPNEPLVQDPPEGVVLGACGRSDIPYIGSSGADCGSGGKGSGGGSRSPRTAASEDGGAPAAPEAPVAKRPERPAKSTAEANPKRKNLFLDL